VLAKKAMRQVKGFARIESHSIELFGLCNNCI
jgi:Fe2+ or Zn2+ uptake regulation protein